MVSPKDMVRFVDGMRMACKWSIDHIIPVYGELREVSNQPAFPAPDADEVGPPPFRGLPAAGCAGILGQGSGPEALFLSASQSFGDVLSWSPGIHDSGRR